MVFLSLIAFSCCTFSISFPEAAILLVSDGDFFPRMTKGTPGHKVAGQENGKVAE